MKRYPPKQPSTPEISQSVIRVLKNQYDHHIKGNSRKVTSLLAKSLIGGVILYKTLSFILLPDPSKIIENNPPPLENNYVPIENPYLINPLSHTEWKQYLVAPGETFTQVLK